MMKELDEMKKEVGNIRKIKEDITYMGLISLIKTILVLWFLSIILVVGGFLLYLNQYEYETIETYDLEADNGGDNSYINQTIGGVE